ncbi:hypothetical protein AVEN_207623-1 [Araneus ventricosus]|uniref:Uncharacterized protein n=1 Tax=Araneus ventricosus TaxID=182803 RepID=A0A4Y2HAV7_ARAVE|nr:hypothetical protein AVEN_207623-1 [Araneus ventricosus]
MLNIGSNNPTSVTESLCLEKLASPVPPFPIQSFQNNGRAGGFAKPENIPSTSAVLEHFFARCAKWRSESDRIALLLFHSCHHLDSDLAN